MDGREHVVAAGVTQIIFGQIVPSQRLIRAKKKVFGLVTKPGVMIACEIPKVMMCIHQLDRAWRRDPAPTNRPRMAVFLGLRHTVLHPMPLSASRLQSYSTFAPENLTTLPHFSVSFSMSLPNSAGVPAS